VENGNRPKTRNGKEKKKEKKTLVGQTPIINITSIFRNLRNSNGNEGRVKNKIKNKEEETWIQRMLHR